jgi:hypothetical protein
MICNTSGTCNCKAGICACQGANCKR